MARESDTLALQRWDDLETLQEYYKDFSTFLHDVQYDVYGWITTPIQYDIGNFIAHGGKYIMVQAQRGQAKTTIAAIFATWSLIQDPKCRVLILSAGAKKANEISKGIYNIIHSMPELECMRPDRTAGDRTSTEAFDIHYTLRGAGMNPSVACIGITSNMQGYRADILIPDDIESSKNATTQVQREQLLHKTRDFTSICSEGRTIYLGTPQTVDSVYNSLPGRGYTVRVWPGRYPTNEEMASYGDTLAPYIADKIKADPSLQTGGGVLGDSGKAVDERLHEDVLCTKELDQGLAYFKLQHMLSTKLTDAERFPLKLRNLVFMHLNPDEAPGKITWQPRPDLLVHPYPGSSLKEEMYRPASCSTDMFPYAGKFMYIDTAGGGQNGDETVAAVTYFLHGYVFLMDVQGFPGGHREDVFDALAAMMYKWQVNTVEVEKNFGHGAFAQSLRPIVDKYYKEISNGELNGGPGIEDYWESGAKELRIIDGLEPIMARHNLIINESIVADDVLDTQKYPLEKRATYQLLHQMARITRTKGSLIHDDRIDAVLGAVRKWVEVINQSADNMIQQKIQAQRVSVFEEFLNRGRRTSQVTNAFDAIQNRNRR
jgi:hypothetical protein